MFRRIRLDSDQYSIIKAIADELDYNRDDVAHDLIELGMTVLIMARKSADGKNSLEKLIKELGQHIEVNHELNIMSQILEKYFDADGKAIENRVK